MPELPDVEGFRKYFESTSLNKKISAIDLSAPKMLKKSTPEELTRYTVNYKFTSASTHGKYFFAALSSKKILMLHFGMTGFLVYFKDPEQASSGIRLQFKFSNGFHLGYDNRRKFGMIMLIDDVDSFLKEKKLGPDPIKNKLTFSEFDKITSKKSGTIKSILMDQSVLSGIGNLYSDEIAYRSEIHPSASFKSLSADERKKLYNNMMTILKSAVKKNGERSLLPENYLLNHREEGEKCPICGGKITHKTIAGRTSYFCRSHQKK
jgi:formamidopyrimidine-DNA glycosylase